MVAYEPGPQDIETIRACPLFEGFEEKALLELAANYVMDKVSRGTDVFAARSSKGYIFVVLSGELKVGHEIAAGGESIESFVMKGDLFGGQFRYVRNEVHEFARVISDKSTLLCIPEELLGKWLRNDANFFQNYCAMVKRKLWTLTQKLDGIREKSISQRLHAFLSEAMERKGRKVGVELAIDFPYTHSDLAAYIGTSRQTVSGLLSTYKKNDRLFFGRSELIIREPDEFLRREDVW